MTATSRLLFWLMPVFQACPDLRVGGEVQVTRTRQGVGYTVSGYCTGVACPIGRFAVSCGAGFAAACFIRS
jgi:hypothetical protein